MTDALLALLHLGTVAVVALALVLPRLRGRTAAALAVLAIAALFAGFASGQGSLEVTTRFAAYIGYDIEFKAFAIETTSGPGWQWGAVAAAWCVLWAAVLTVLRRTDDPPGRPAPLGAGVRPILLPLLLAWSSFATTLLLEKLAAPAGLVRPLPFERALLPAALAAAALLAQTHRRVLVVLAWVSVFVTLGRLPLALFGSWATYEELGTSLDVHSITRIANPLARELLQLEPKSAEQLGWLLWGPNLVVLPALYMMSVGGIAFAIAMFVGHPSAGARDGE